MASELGSLAAIFLSGVAAWRIVADGKCGSLTVLLIGFMVRRPGGNLDPGGFPLPVATYL